MSEQEREQDFAGKEPVKEQAEYTLSVQPDFMREKIKQKPVRPAENRSVRFFCFDFLPIIVSPVRAEKMADY